MSILPRCVTLKLEIVDFPALVRLSLTQDTMVSSITFCPSPRSSKIFRVYLGAHTGSLEIPESGISKQTKLNSFWFHTPFSALPRFL